MSRRGASAKSRTFSTTSIAPPRHSAPNISKTETSKAIDDARMNPRRRSGEKRCSTQSRKFTTLRCVISTPFGFPVEPEV